jgi:hypothetical protein
MGKQSRKISRSKPPEPAAMTQREKQIFQLGVNVGRDEGMNRTIAYFEEKLSTLSDVKGIGEAYHHRILLHMGFEEMEDDCE